MGEGVQLQDFPQYINKEFIGFNFETQSSNIDDLNESMLTSHEQHILGLWDALVTKLQLEDHLEISPMVVKKNYLSFDPLLYKKIADAIRLSADQGADVISVSYTASLSSDLFLFVNNDREQSVDYLQDAINYAKEKGSLVFAAASNNKQRNHSLDKAAPCDLQGVICVANSSFDYQVVSASGEGIDSVFYGYKLTTFDKDYKKEVVTGTSYATPLLAFMYAYTKVTHEEKIEETLLRLKQAKGHKARSLYGLKNPYLLKLSELDLTQ